MKAALARRAALLAGLALAYFVAGKLGLLLAFLHASASPVWPATGIALAAFMALGPRVWPAIFVGAFLVNLTTAGSGLTSLGIAAGNTLEGLLGALLVERFASGRRAFKRASDVFRFTVLAAGLSTTVSATFGVTSLALGGFASWSQYGSIWLTWWLGDAVGALVVAPPLLLWFADPSVRLGRRRVLEGGALLCCLVLAGLVVFGGLFPSTTKDYPLEFLCIPFLLWAAFRFGVRGAATSSLLMAGLAVSGTLQGYGPFVRDRQNESLLLLQAFSGVVAAMTLIVAAVVSERRRVEAQLLELSLRDPLTGLANYRCLMGVLEGEIRRYQRSQRPFALLFLDLDGLKGINDRYGHLVGSRALCRVAEVLRASCRNVDTAARFGGDEFALVLPETDEAAAGEVARRVSERLGRDDANPRISVSTGVAVCPRDGETVEALIGIADRGLYARKARPGRRPRP